MVFEAVPNLLVAVHSYSPLISSDGLDQVRMSPMKFGTSPSSSIRFLPSCTYTECNVKCPNYSTVQTKTYSGGLAAIRQDVYNPPPPTRWLV